MVMSLLYMYMLYISEIVYVLNLIKYFKINIKLNLI